MSIEGFRNYARLDLDLSGGDLHLFVGPNGSGKTNLLEAVSLLSLTRSCRGAEEGDLPLFGAPFYRIRGRAVLDGGEPVRLEAVAECAQRLTKACFVNDVRVTAMQMVGRLPSVIFLPEDMDLFTGPPAYRRRFLDQLLSQVSQEYLAALSEYQRALRQRNALLKSIAAGQASAGDLLPWESALAESGSLLIVHRLELVETFNLTLGRELQALGEEVTGAFVYERKGTERERGVLREEMQQLLLENRARDLLLCSTSVGPHRDDWHVTSGGRSIASFASRGQQRVCMVALLFLQVSFLEIRRGEKPIILLDDVFSELDDGHQSRLIQALDGHNVLLTGTHLPPTLTGAVTWSVEEGRVRKADAIALPRRATLAMHG